jgi:dienelactone hydrolase
LKLRIPLLLTFITALIMLPTMFIPHYAGTFVTQQLNSWYMVVFGLGLVLGIVTLLQAHFRKVARRQRDWGYSLVAIASFFGMALLGIIWGIEQDTAFNWLFTNLYAPLDATMFSLLGFFVASAAYRTFRARTIEATLLLVAALVVMFGRIPLGEAIFHKAPNVAEWIMSNPGLGAKRGIILGVSLGGVAMSLRIMLGIERSHLGGDTSQ